MDSRLHFATIKEEPFDLICILPSSERDDFVKTKVKEENIDNISNVSDDEEEVLLETKRVQCSICLKTLNEISIPEHTRYHESNY